MNRAHPPHRTHHQRRPCAYSARWVILLVLLTSSIAFLQQLHGHYVSTDGSATRTFSASERRTLVPGAE